MKKIALTFIFLFNQAVYAEKRAFLLTEEKPYIEHINVDGVDYINSIDFEKYQRASAKAIESYGSNQDVLLVERDGLQAYLVSWEVMMAIRHKTFDPLDFAEMR